MFIESRFDLPRITSLWATAFESFRLGNTFEAFEAGRQLAANGSFTCVDDYLLWADILRAVGRPLESLDLFRTPLPVFTADFRAEVQLARTLSAKGRILAAIRRLEAASAVFTSDGLHQALLDAERASELAGIHLASTARDVIDSVQQGPHAGHPWVRYGLAYAFFRLRQWKPALDLFVGISVDCPQWPRPWVLAHRCLASLGRADDASAIATAAATRFPQDWPVFATLLEDHIARNRWSQLADLLDAGLAKWAATVDDISPLKSLLVRSRWRSYDASEAIDVARTFDDELAARLEKLRAAAYYRRFRLPVPSLVQDRYLCVATSVAMVLRFYGEGSDADPAVLNAEMGAEDGVSSWQLDRWAITRGLRAVDIRADVDAVRGMLDEGIPLLACRQGVLMSHLEVIVGYDDALEEIEVTDPDEGLPHFIPYDAVSTLYGKASEALVALLPDDDAALMQKIDRGWIDREAAIVRRARRRLHEGDVDAARATLVEFPPGSRRRRFLTLESGESVAPSHALREAAHSLADDPEVDPTTRFNLALNLFAMGAEADAERILREFDLPIPRTLERYRRAMCSFWKGDMRRAERGLLALLERMPHSEDVWFTLSIVHRAFGRTEEAERALSNTLEMAPFHLGANLERIRVARGSTPVDELAERAREIVARHPRAGHARSVLARLEFARGESLRAEKCWLEYLELVPFSSAARSELRQWYLRQNRPDLAGAVVDEPVPASDDKPDSTGDFESCLGKAWEEYQSGARGDATAALAARRAANRLKADEAVEAALLEVNFRLREASMSGAAVDLEAVLPASFPLPVHDRLASFLGRIDHRWTSPPAAAMIAAWADGVVPCDDLTPAGRLARTYLDEIAGTTHQARMTYLEIAESSSIDEAYYRAAVIAFRRGDFGDAMNDVRKCVALTPGYSEAWGLAVDIGHAAQSARLVLEGLERRAAIAPYDEEIAGQYLEALANMSGVGDARSWLEAVESRYTKEFVEWWRIELLVVASSWSAILAAIDGDFRERRPREAFAFELQALEGLGRFESYQRQLAVAIEQFPDDPYISARHARSLVNVNPAEAHDVHVKLLATHPDAAAERIVTYTAPGDLCRHVLEAIGGSERPAEAREIAVRAFARALSAPKYAATRLAVFEQLAAEDPTSALTLGVLATCYERAGRWADAERCARASFEIDPYDPIAALRLGSVLVESDPEGALAMLRESHDRTGDARALAPMAKALSRLGRVPEAITAYYEVIEADPADGDAIVALAGLDRAGPRLFGAFQAALRSEWPPTGPRFAIVAVETAMAIRKPLLWSWERAAVDRYEGIELLPVEAATESERETLATMLYAWASTLDRPHIKAVVAHTRMRAVKLEAVTRFKPWGKNDQWMPTRGALERRAAIACAKFKAQQEAQAAENQ